MPRTNVIKSILGRFVPFSLVSLCADIVYELEDSQSLYQIFHHFLRDRLLFMPQVGTEEKRLFGQFSLSPNPMHHKIIATQPI